jgi:hypothetical protein
VTPFSLNQLTRAFDGFARADRRDAPLIWALILAQPSFRQLERVIEKRDNDWPEVTGVGGEGGWTISWRQPGDNWPEGATYCAELDDADSYLGSGPEHAEFHCSDADMRRYMSAAVYAYLVHRPDLQAEAERLLALLESP